MDEKGVRRWLVRQVGRRGPVIEIGSGDGALTVALARRGLAITAVDLDEAQLQAGHASAVAQGVSDRVTWVKADGQRLDGFPAGAYAVALLAFVLHHMEDPRLALQAAWRVLAPSGRLVIAEMLPRGPDADDLCHRITLEDWLTLIVSPEPEGVRLTALPHQEWLLAVLEKAALPSHAATPSARHTGTATTSFIHRRPQVGPGGHDRRKRSDKREDTLRDQ